MAVETVTMLGDLDSSSPAIFLKHGQKVLKTAFWYVDMRATYTNGLATELNADSQTPEIDNDSI